jgi:signal transduction histidine kinase
MVRFDEYADSRPWLTDMFIVIALFGAAVLGVHLVGPGDERPEPLWVADLLAGLACVALLRARQHPRAAVSVTAACAVTTGAMGYLLTPLLLAPVMVALYWLALLTTTRTTWWYGGITSVSIVGIAVGTEIDGAVALRLIGPALWLALPLVMGSRARLRHAYLDAVEARAEHAERTREEEARLRATEERVRIARDLHDVVAHHMAVANAQAGTAAHLLETDPNLTKQILADLQATTSSAMLELRDTVGVLRAADSGAESLEPAPGLDYLPGLLETCESAGLRVDLRTTGDPRELPAGVDLTAYRIIQEALTNATKHSASPTASLALHYASNRLTITIRNDADPGPGTDNTQRGYGIVGMSERARAVGGELRITDNDTTFEVMTSLPLHPDASLREGTTP